MKNQQVSVDYWAMGKAMITYGALTALVWVMLRLFNAVFSLPRRLRAQQQTIQDTLAEMQKRYPDLNLTEEDLKEAEKELENYGNFSNEENEETKNKDLEKPSTSSGEANLIEDKKTI